MGGLWCGATCAKNVVNISPKKKNVGQISLGGCGIKKARKERMCLATGVSCRKKRSWSLPNIAGVRCPCGGRGTIPKQKKNGNSFFDPLSIFDTLFFHFFDPFSCPKKLFSFLFDPFSCF